MGHNPDVIIADEPTGNLDAEAEDAMLQILVRMAHEDGKCAIIVTHIADEVIGIRAGKLLTGEKYDAIKEEDEE